MAEERKIKLDFLKDSAIILALSTAIIYIFSYIYIFNFLKFYKISSDFNIQWSVFMLTKYSLTIFELICPLILKAMFSCFIIYIFLDENISQLVIITISFLLFAFLLKIYSSTLENTVIRTICDIIGILIIVTNYMIPIGLVGSLQHKKILWNKFSEYLNSEKFIVIHLSLVFTFLILIGFFVSKIAYEDASSKNEYFFDEDKSAVLIFQDEEKSFFLVIDENGESQNKYYTSDSNEIQLSKFNSKIIIQ